MPVTVFKDWVNDCNETERKKERKKEDLWGSPISTLCGLKTRPGPNSIAFGRVLYDGVSNR